MRFRLLGACLAVAAPCGAADAQTVLRDGFEESCSVDTDGDRLMDCDEVLRQTSMVDADTDDDGLSDGDEVLGTIDGLDLAALGVDPRHKDLLLEHDWQDDNVDPAVCGSHTHKPDAATLEDLRLAFAAAPLPNPDGTPGVNLIQDIGQDSGGPGPLTGGTPIAIPDATVIGTSSGPHFQSLKSANLASNRIGYFHYVIHAHRYSSNPQSSGFADVVGDDMIVTLGCSAYQAYIRNTIMHELGHNLGLQHGGNTPCNRAPNYNSVMNYSYQFSGIDKDCHPGGDGVMNFSIGARSPLDEHHLDETRGMCGDVPIDWDLDGVLVVDVAKDINPYAGVANPAETQVAECSALLTVLNDFNDWNAISFGGLPGAPGGGQQIPAVVATCGPIPTP